MNDVKKFPTLYGLASNGKVKEWQTSAMDNGDNTGCVVTLHGYVDGKKQESRKATEPKNVGRANETTGFEQAISEAQSLWNKKKDKQYVEDINKLSDAPTIPLPMLAHKYPDKKSKIRFPCYVQPKLDGIRCLATRKEGDVIEYTSRGGKYFKTLDHLTSGLLEMLEPGETVDGELFSEELTFEEITSIVRNEKTDKGRDKLQYHVYDFPVVRGLDISAGFAARASALYDRWESLDQKTHIKFVTTLKVKSEEGIQKAHSKFVGPGMMYEGTIIRNSSGSYKFKNRSTDLLKMKDFHDAEFEIIGGREGRGKFKGQCVFVCRTDQNTPVDENNPHSTFEAVCKGTTEQRRWQFENLDQLLGNMLTVRYQTLTSYGVPLFPVGISIREEGI